MSGGGTPLRPPKKPQEEEEEEEGAEGVELRDVARVTPVKRRRLLNLVDLRSQGGMTSSSVDLGGASSHSLSHPFVGVSASSSLGHGRRSRTPLTDLDSKFVAKSGLCVSLDSGDAGGFRGGANSGGLKITHLAGSSASVGAGGVGGGTGHPCRDDSVSRFPRLDQCAHFHYEYVELPPITLSLVCEELKPLSQGVCVEDTENKSLLVQVSSMGRSWVIRRTYDNFRFLDKQLHRCCYDRKFSQLKELPPEQNFPGEEKENAMEKALSSYLERLSDVAGSLITCGPVLSWLELDNRGHRLIVTDDSDINTPAVAAAYVVKRYTAQASDEISFEVGDMISVIDMPPPEESIWWRGKRGFQVGFFPCECVQVIGDKVPQAIHPQALTLPPQRSSSTPPQGPHHSPLQPTSSSGSAQEPMKPVLRKHGKLIAFFRSFILSRPSRRKLKQSGILRERVFGCDLGEHLLNSGHDIPMVLKCCAEFIESHGAVDGIYRLSGITSNIQKLRNAFDEERVPDLYGDESILQDIHCVSSVLKMYFRELPNPLLTYQLYDKFVTAVMQNEDVRLLHVRDVVQQLPPPHYRTLEYLIQHLARIAALSGNTGMTPRNIAIVWAPNLLRSKDLEKGGVAALQDVGTQAVVTEYLVRYVDLIFNDKIPLFPASTNGMEGTPKKLRPKSLAISTPTKLLSIDEARTRALAAIKSDQKYIEVGGGPQSLPKTYHTVIDLPSRKGGSLKQKKSPLGWKTLFSKGKHQRKASTPNEISLNVSDPAVTETDNNSLATKRLRPVKSVESLVSTPASLHSNRNSQVIDQISKRDASPVVTKERRGSANSECSSIPSPRTHNRSVSHDSYFNLLERNEPAMDSSSGVVKEERDSDTELSPESSKIFLDISELNLEFNTSEAEMKIFSEDDTLKSTSIEDTLSRSTVDVDENISMGSDVGKSKENVSIREKKSLRDKLKKRFTSPNTHRKETSISDSSEDSRSNSLKRASSVIKEKLVQALSPETSRKKVESNITHPASPGGSPKFKHKKAESKDSVSTEIHVDTTQTEREIFIFSSTKDNGTSKESAEKPDEEKERVSIESTLIDPDLLDKITRMRVSPSVSASEVSSVSLAEATVSDNESFTLGSSSVNGSIGTEGNKEVIGSDNGTTLPQSLTNTPSTPPVTIVSDPQFQEEISKRELPLKVPSEGTIRKEEGPNKITKSSRDRPSSLLGIPPSETCSLGSALTSPETPQGDSTFLEIQYHPLSDTTEPSTPSESHFAGTNEGEDVKIPPQHSSPLSPDLSSSSADDPLENGPLYENVEITTSLSPTKLSSFEAPSINDPFNKTSKITPEVETPTAEESELEYENIQYSALEQSYYDEDDSNIFDSDSVTPCYENLQKDFPLEIDKVTDDNEVTYENVENPNITTNIAEADDTEHEEYSFKEPSNYENVDFSGCIKEGKTEAEIEGEVVYQQVKYLRKSIQEVNEIFNESPEVKSVTSSQLINISISQPSQEEKKKEEKDYDNAGDSECLDSPVTPSSSSLITEVLVLPSFSSPTESTTEDASSSDASESQSSPKTPHIQATSPARETSFVATSSANSLTSFIPSLSPPSPDVTGVPVTVTSPLSRASNTGLTPSPWPRQKQGHVWPPVPKPRNLPSLNFGSPVLSPTSSSSPSSSSSDSPKILLKQTNDQTPTEVAGLNYPSQLKNVVHIVNVPCSNESTNEKLTDVRSDIKIDEKYEDSPSDIIQSVDLAKENSAVEQDQNNDCDPRVCKLDEAQKRERIEKYKEERRSFLREKYKSESFKGEKDDMLLRLKQKATSPSRQDDVDDRTESTSYIIERERGRTLSINQKMNDYCGSKSEASEDWNSSDQNDALFNARFQSNSVSVKFSSDTKSEKSCKEFKLKSEPLLHRSISEDSRIVADKTASVAETESAPLSSKSNPRTFSDSTFHSTREDDINVKERVAIWSRHENSNVNYNQKRESVTTSLNPKVTPPKLRKVQSNSNSTDVDTHLKKCLNESPASKCQKTDKSPEEKLNTSTNEDGRRLSGSGKETKPLSPVHKNDKPFPFASQQSNSSSKFKPAASDKKPVLISQKSESDLFKEHPLLKARSYSVGTGLGTSTSNIRCSSSQQKRIKDMKALFERETPNQENAKPVLVRSTRETIGN